MSAGEMQIRSPGHYHNRECRVRSVGSSFQQAILRARQGVADQTDVADVYGLRREHYASAHKIQRSRRGGRFYCPVCGSTSAVFGSFAGRRHARCPHCGSLERHRWLWSVAQGDPASRRLGTRLLHVAPEPAIAHALDRHWQGKRVSVDAFDPDVDVRADLTALPFASAYVDVILCSHVLEHIEDDATALSELYRVLKPGGRAYFMVPIARKLAVTYEDPTVTVPAERAIAFGHPYHVRICGLDYGDRVRAAGFTVVEQDAARLSRHQRRRARLNKAILYLATKPGIGASITAGHKPIPMS